MRGHLIRDGIIQAGEGERAGVITTDSFVEHSRFYVKGHNQTIVTAVETGGANGVNWRIDGHYGPALDRVLAVLASTGIAAGATDQRTISNNVGLLVVYVRATVPASQGTVRVTYSSRGPT